MSATPIRAGWTDVDKRAVDISPEVTPRRRRNGTVCGSLRVDGQPITFEGLTALGVRFTPGAANGTKLDLHELRCTEQRNTVGAGWVQDICTSSWQRDCPFKAAAESAPATRYSFVLPAPALAAPPPSQVRARAYVQAHDGAEQARREALAEAVAAELVRLGLRKKPLSFALGKQKGYVGHAITLRQPGPLQRIAAHLGIS